MMRFAWLIALAAGCGSSHGSTDGNLGEVTSCVTPADQDMCAGTGLQPLCCPHAGPLPPTVMCSQICYSDDDCTLVVDRPFCSRPGTAAGLCMPANQSCCWFCD